MKPLRPSITAALILSCVASSACRSARSNRPDAGAATGVETRARVSITAEGARVNGTFLEDGHGIAGARVTVLDAPTASTAVSGANGTWSITVPVAQPVYLRVTSGSYRTIQSGVIVAQAGEMQFPLEMVPSSLLERIYSTLDIAENRAAGALAVRFNLPGRDRRTTPTGFGATLSAGGGIPVALGSGGPRRSDVTISEETILLMLNVAPGPTTVTARAPAGLTCEPARGSLPTVRVDPRVVTFVAFNCR